jgi:hypothetical protein
VDLRRALTELEELFAAQWATGMVPHIVFRAGPEQPYFPGPEWWDTAVSPAAPASPLQTTGICQPPVHALALQRIWQLAQQARLDTRALPYPSQRPTNWDYDRYLGLVGLLRKYHYDDALIYREYPFLIKDVFFSAVLVAANDALLDLADVAEASDEVRGQLTGWRDRGRAGLARRLDPEAGLCFEYDVRTGADIRLRTFAGFAPLFTRTADMSQQAAQLRRLDSEDSSCGGSTPKTSAATRGCAGRCCRARPRPSRPSSRATTGAGRPGRSSTGCCGSRCASSATRPAPTRSVATRWPRSPPGPSVNTSTLARSITISRQTMTSGAFAPGTLWLTIPDRPAFPRLTAPL